MSRARVFSAFGGPAASRDERLVRGSFWRKLQRVIVLVPFSEDLIAAYYCATDRATPGPVKAALFAALAYFIMPLDAIPDFAPMLGFADDAAMLAGAIRLVAGYITPEHRERAQSVMARIIPGR